MLNPRDINNIMIIFNNLIKYYLIKEADVVLGGFGLTENRNQLIDFPYVTTTSSMALMIPKPTVEKSNRISAVVKPFQLEVYVYLKYHHNE